MTLSRSFTALPIFLACALVGCGSASGLESSHGGRSLGAWMQAYWSAALMGGTTTRDGDVRFLALPNATDPDMDGVFSGEIDQTLGATDAFALPLFIWIGETYTPASGTPDDDVNVPPRADFLATHVVLTLDGTAILDTSRDSLTDYYFEAQRFAAPIVYETPTDYGATAALWVKGVGILHAPLSRGAHTLHLEEMNDAAMVGYSNTWHITVE